MWRYFTKNQTLRYVDVLQDFVRSYNDTYHRSIGMAPSAVNGANQEMVWQRMYDHDGGGTPKYLVGDHVRISKAKRHFAKGYMANWTEELFTIVDANRSDPPVYRLVDWHGDRLDGTFYEPELQKVVVPVGKTYRIESELRRRNNGREVLVKWFGYPESFNSWKKTKQARVGQIIISGILPVFGNRIQGYRNSKRMAVNGMVERLCKEEDVGYVDLWDSFVGREDMYGRDGLHLSGKGAAVFAEGLSGAVASGLGKVRFLN